jgi:hypothetical protein
MPGPGPIGQQEMTLRTLGSQGVLARTFSVLPGPQGANRLQTPGTTALAGRGAGASTTGLVSADHKLELPSEQR